MTGYLQYKGERFGNLIVVDVKEASVKGSRTKFICECDCGMSLEAIPRLVVSGRVVSCGCSKISKAQALGKKNRTHGMTRTSEYGSWVAMKARCYDETRECYKNYGGRGIRVCDRWLNSFELFFKDIGPKPGPEYTVDRMDNDGDYEPDNCRWATRQEQSNNRRNSKLIQYRGSLRSLSEIARLHNLSPKTLARRVAGQKLDEHVLDNNVAPTAGTDHPNADVLYEMNGCSKNLFAWCRELNLNYRTIHYRIFKKGMAFKDAISPNDMRKQK